MKVTLNWLKRYVEFNGSPEELAERLTMLGLEVESTRKLGGEFAGIVVGQVLSREKHPNADKLTVCRVADGQGERQIVCGAQNFQPGDKVALILPGASLPLKAADKEPFTIKVGKIRGVESHGMMCSAAELGVDPAKTGHKIEDGILVLRPDALVGQPFAEYLGGGGQGNPRGRCGRTLAAYLAHSRSDVVYDLEVTPNRSDLNSVIAIAAEVAALTGQPLHAFTIGDELWANSTEKTADLVSVRLEAPDLCPRYTALVVQGVKIGPSPDWLRSVLEKVGLRSINNVVDVTNFVMLETGQPLHAFDYHLIARSTKGKPTLVIRRALTGEKFVTLDGREHTLTADNLLIADEQKAIALAGVMGGQNTEINPSTVDVLIESAYFAPANIRRTSKLLGLRTDASYRFERGADISMSDCASVRCAQLILELAGGACTEGVVDAYPEPVKPREITLRHERTTALLGVEIPAETQAKILASLGLNELNATPERGPTSTWWIPTRRLDLKREVDLIEEIARLYGVDKIPSTAPRAAVGMHPFDAIYDEFAEVRRILAGMGLAETQGQTLINDAAAALVSSDLVRLANPLSSDMNALRPSLLPGLLDTFRINLGRKNGDLQLFEVGRVFTQLNGSMKEGWRVAMALTGARNPDFWSGVEREARCDIFDLKGMVEELLETLGLRGVTFATRSGGTGLFLESAAVALGGKLPLGQLGQLLPTLAKRYEARDPVLLAELDLDQLLARRNRTKSFKPLPQFPSSQRDVAMIVTEATTHESVLSLVRQAKLANLESVELFDVFRGRHVPEGHKSLAYAFTYRAADRTLKDDEINTDQAKLVAAFRSGLKATIRE